MAQLLEQIAEIEALARKHEDARLADRIHFDGDAVMCTFYDFEALIVRKLTPYLFLQLCTALREAEELITHAVELGHLGEGSTQGWAQDWLAKYGEKK